MKRVAAASARPRRSIQGVQPPATTRSLPARLVAVAVALQLTAGLLAAVRVSPPAPAPAEALPARIAIDETLEGAIALDGTSEAAPQRQALEDERDQEVERLLSTRTAAVLGRNR